MSKFDLGRVVATPGALEALTKAGVAINSLLKRHEAGDWGDVSPEDWWLNAEAMNDGGRLFSVYKIAEGTKIWLITEAVGDDGKRASTCALLPGEY